MSLFGKMVPMRQGILIHPEVRALLEEVIVEAGRIPCGKKQHEEMVEDLYTHLEIIMFYEILTYLPGECLDEFVRLNDLNRPRWEIDKFLQLNMPNAEEVIEDRLPSFRRFTRVKSAKVFSC